MELQQSPLYETYIHSLHWHVEIVEGIKIFLRTFPILGGIAKMQRFDKLPDIQNILPLLKKYNVKRFVLEAGPNVDEEELISYRKTLSTYVRVLDTPFIPSKTIVVDLRISEKEIFEHFSEAKRRAVRRAIKNGVSVTETDAINELIKVKNRSAGMFGFVTTSGAKNMWDAFKPNHATTLLAYQHPSKQPIGGIFLIFWNDVAYYWIAGARKNGKKLAAPTLLVWEAIKSAKKRKMKYFDFLGVWDERFPSDNRDWLGFTKFKEGFGGEMLYYPTHKRH
jgi:hypothetical protein